jgi:hypothetical protein
MVRGLAVTSVEPRNVRPHILDADGKEKAARGERLSALERGHKALVILASNGADTSIEERGAVSCRLGAAALTQLRWRDPMQPEVPIDPARFPIARVV